MRYWHIERLQKELERWVSIKRALFSSKSFSFRLSFNWICRNHWNSFNLDFLLTKIWIISIKISAFQTTIQFPLILWFHLTDWLGIIEFIDMEKTKCNYTKRKQIFSFWNVKNFDEELTSFLYLCFFKENIFFFLIFQFINWNVSLFWFCRRDFLNGKKKENRIRWRDWNVQSR